VSISPFSEFLSIVFLAVLGASLLFAWPCVFIVSSFEILSRITMRIIGHGWFKKPKTAA
jgi:hypothetical protein